jgi:DNA repair protein RecO (recombination protein O)
MPLYRDEAVVLRSYKLAEADRIVSFLTRDHGRVRAVVKGVRRTTSRFGARAEPMTHVDVQFAVGRNLDTVAQLETIRPHGASLTHDYPRWTAGMAMLEAAERLTPVEKEPALQQFLLLVAGLRALEAGDRPAGLLLDSYLLRSLALAGWAPSFGDCARCGAPGPHTAFHPSAGGVLCPDCRVAGSAMPSPACVELLGALLAGDWPAATASAERDRRSASGLVAAFVNWHLERGLKSLPLVERPAAAAPRPAEAATT